MRECFEIFKIFCFVGYHFVDFLSNQFTLVLTIPIYSEIKNLFDLFVQDILEGKYCPQQRALCFLRAI